MAKQSIEVKGIEVDAATRCRHYHSEVDIIAIKFHCCEEYYACYYCHKENADHQETKWPRDQWEEQAILCGNCSGELTINEYMSVYECPECKHPFNERCSFHYPLYFDMEK